MPFNDPLPGEKTRLGMYLNAGQVAQALRAAADAIEQYGPACWGALVRCEHLQHDPHPLWNAKADLTLTVGFRDLAPHVAEALAPIYWGLGPLQK